VKRVTIPDPQKVLGVRNGQPILVNYGLCELEVGTEGYEEGVWGFLDREVWTNEYWRTGSNDKLQIVVRLIRSFKGKKPRECTDISDRDHEMVVECAMLKGKNLDPALAFPILVLLCSLTEATDVQESG
jgi:hypothetical protein